MFGFGKKEHKKKEEPEPFTPVQFELVQHCRFSTRKEVKLNIAKAKKEGFEIKWGDYYGCGFYMNLYRDPRKKVTIEKVTPVKHREREYIPTDQLTFVKYYEASTMSDVERIMEREEKKGLIAIWGFHKPAGPRYIKTYKDLRKEK